MRVVDGPILKGTKRRGRRGSGRMKASPCMQYVQKWRESSYLLEKQPLTCLKFHMMLGGFASPSWGQCLIPMEVCPSSTSAHSSVTELKRISFCEVYSKYWKKKKKKRKTRYVTILQQLKYSHPLNFWTHCRHSETWFRWHRAVRTFLFRKDCEAYQSSCEDEYRAKYMVG